MSLDHVKAGKDPLAGRSAMPVIPLSQDHPHRRRRSPPAGVQGGPRCAIIVTVRWQCFGRGRRRASKIGRGAIGTLDVSEIAMLVPTSTRHVFIGHPTPQGGAIGNSRFTEPVASVPFNTVAARWDGMGHVWRSGARNTGYRCQRAAAGPRRPLGPATFRMSLPIIHPRHRDGRSRQPAERTK